MRGWLRVVAWIAGGLAGLALVVFFVGLFLPVRHSVTLTREVHGTPEEVWAVITGVEEYAEWRPGVERAERIEPIDGWPAWREEGKEGPITYAVAAVEPPKTLVTEIVDEGLPFGGRWTYQLEPTPIGTRLTITENGFVYNPFYRLVSRFFIGHATTVEAYVGALEARMAGRAAADTARVEPAPPAG